MFVSEKLRYIVGSVCCAIKSPTDVNFPDRNVEI